MRDVSNRSVWDEWLDGLEEAAAELERQLADGELLSFPDLTTPPLEPSAPRMPGEHVPRAGQLLDRLERLERIAQTQRDSVVTQLHQLPPPRRHPGTVPSYELGGAIDIAG
jgi:hypothetical protein